MLAQYRQHDACAARTATRSRIATPPILAPVDVLARGACLCRAHLSSFLCLVRSTVPPYDAINTDTELCLCCWSLVLMNPETGGFQCSF